MESRTIGSLEVSVLGLGCNNFGRRVDEGGTRRVVDAAIDAGVTLFDTADIYGGTLSESFLGRILQGRRDRIVLATKFGMDVAPGKTGAAPVRFSRWTSSAGGIRFSRTGSCPGKKRSTWRKSGGCWSSANFPFT